MKIPVGWLKEYVDTRKSADQLAVSFTLLGLLLDKKLPNDVLDLEHRMDRSDWLSITGCARDLAAFEKAKFKFPECYVGEGKQPSKDQVVNIRVECSDMVNRFNTRVFRNISVKQSPYWLKKRLEEYGIPSINNVVDITNYVMVELGQPMHAQDLAKFEKQEIVIRQARRGEKVTTLLGEEIELDDFTFVLTQNNKPTVIGGIVGGRSTSVDETTRNIILDAGNYNQTAIRKASRRLKIQNETVLRYDKFLHPMLTEIALDRATKLILEIAGGEYYQNFDWYPHKTPIRQMVLRLSRVEQIGGIRFNLNIVKETLCSLGYTIIEETLDKLKVEVPYFRTDVEVEDDLVSDILRINNYEKIPSSELIGPTPKNITSATYKFEEKLKDILVSTGLYEHITDPIVKAREGDDSQVLLENALNADKNALRTSIYETLWPVINAYKKNGANEVSLFEIGKVYGVKGSKNKHSSYTEESAVGAVYINQVLSYYESANQVKKILSAVFQNLGISKERYMRQNGRVLIFKDKTALGELAYDSFDLSIKALMSLHENVNRVRSNSESAQTEDISIVLDINRSFGDVYASILNFDRSFNKVSVEEEYIGSEIGENKKSILIRIEAQTPSATWKPRLITHLKNNLHVEVRQ